ncbi:MAG: hypothetical protein V2A73_12085 [Pseudomonadota bacterium]
MTTRAFQITLVMLLLVNDARAVTVSAPFDVIGSSAPVSTTTCIREVEPILTRVNRESAIWLFAAHGLNTVSTTIGTWNNWNKDMTAPDANTPFWIDQSGVNRLVGDAWSTFSEDNNLVYSTFIGHATETSASCLAIGATSPEDIPSERWDYPATCAVNASTDHPIITFDNFPNAPALFAVSNPLTGNVRVDAFVPCNPGQPGVAGGGCARSATTAFTLSQNHYDAAVNHCSGNLLVAYREGGTNDIRLLSLHRSTLAPLTNPTKGFLVMASQTWSGFSGPMNTGCGSGSIRRCKLGTTDCAGVGTANSCQRVFGGPQIVVEPHNNFDCYAAVSWDVFVSDAGGNLWSRSRIAILKVTNDSSPTIVRSQISNGNPNSQWNDYFSQVVAAPDNDSLGWFWVTDTWGACSLFMAGGIDSNFGIASFTGTGKFPSYTWPAAHTTTPPISDYWKGTGRGTKLYPVWNEATATSATCSWGTCDHDSNGTATTFNIAAKMVEVTP